jgi:YidC/Oxa1 family membrane protein insertase
MLPLFLQIPFLISALFLLTNYQPMSGHHFLFIHDLMRPDELLPLGATRINLLPLLICLVTFGEWLIDRSDQKKRFSFFIITAVLVVLIYRAPAGVCLYWLTSSTLSLGRAGAKRYAAFDHRRPYS